jgi:hypothetical protein
MPSQRDGLMQVPQAVVDEAAALLPTLDLVDAMTPAAHAAVVAEVVDNAATEPRCRHTG